MDLWELADLCTPWCILVAATLRLADHIDSGHTHIDQLAVAAHADASALHRVLRHLVAKGIFEEPQPGHFALNDLARGLRDNRIGFDLEGIGGRMAHSWSTLLTAVRTGRPAYQEVFGRPWWDDLTAHPPLADEFDALMSYAGHGVPDPDVLPDLTAWPSIKTVVDVGGGTGALLAEVLKAHPHLHGTLVDLPRTIARSHEVFTAAGVTDRVAAAAQSFFDPLPAGADLYFLKSILSDWPDAEATAILRRCAEAATPTSRIVLVNGVTPNEAPDPDLLMLVLVGGKGRTLGEFRLLAAEAGLQVQAAARRPSGRFLVECGLI
ncbi:MAG: methyltransferase [Bryobacteraceae bacterium]